MSRVPVMYGGHAEVVSETVCSRLESRATCPELVLTGPLTEAIRSGRVFEGGVNDRFAKCWTWTPH